MQVELDPLLLRWEENYKKGLLSFWLLLLLQERPSYPFEINNLITQLSQGSLSVDDNSIYRALNRFEDLGIVSSHIHSNPHGPDRRYYSLTADGQRLLQQFILRNIQVLRSADVTQRIDAILASNPSPRQEMPS